MIDKLELRCWFRDPDRFRLDSLGIPLLGSIDAKGELYALRHAWESVPSSFSDMAFRVFDYCADRPNPDPFIVIKASPAKLCQGHNVYGSDDLGECALVLIELLALAYPSIVDALDWSSWDVAEVDITYASWARSAREAKQFIQALLNISNGQTKARTGFIGTAYFGKMNSRLKKLKVYDKLAEILQYLVSRKGSKNDPAQYFPQRLLDWCEGMIRWEATLKARWFERRGISTSLIEMKKVFDAQAYWTEATKDVFAALEGEKMNSLNDEEILEMLKTKFSTVNSCSGKTSYTKANGAYRTYLAIKANGFRHTLDLMPSKTFYRHLDMVIECGLSKAQLQNMTGNQGAEIIPLVRYAVVEFRNQFPDWYVPPRKGENVPKLSLVA